MRKKPEIILASASPRRAELLREAGIAFRTVVSESHEPARKPPGIPTGVWPMCLAYMKAHAVQRQLEGLQVTRGRGTAPAITILAADTIVVAGNGLREQILNKAADRGHARRILNVLNRTRHRVITGCCLLRGAQLRLFSATAICRLSMSKTQLESYLDSGLWRGKAGAYGIQDPVADPFVELIAGEFATVVGLPIGLVQSELATFRRDEP